MKAIVCGILALSLWLVPLPACASYSYTDIHPAGWLESRAVGVNADGDVAGYGTTPFGERGFIRSHGGITELLPPGASSARASWVNGRGEVVGTAVTDGRNRAFLYSGGTYIDPAPGWAFSEAAHVGEDGTVTGTGEFGAFVYRGGAAEILPGLSSAVGANAAGQILGTSGGDALLFIPGRGYVNVRPPGSDTVIPRGMNESGLVAVTSMQADSEMGYIYSGGFYIFMTPPGWSSSNAMSVNNLSQVAGYGVSPAGRRSFVRSGSSYEELSCPGWRATEAVSINDSGQVAGSGDTGSGEIHAFLASPLGATAGEAAANLPGGSGGGGGGCSVSVGGMSGTLTFSAAATLAVLFLPLAFLEFRRRAARIRVKTTPRRS